jgi:hypothetical protein
MDEHDKTATGRDIILEIVRALQGNVEPLLFSTVAPTRYCVYLHPADYERLEGIFPLVADQARRALDKEVARWNEAARPSRLPRKWLGGRDPAPPIEPPADGWDIRFEPDADGEMAPGDIAVASDLTLPARPELEGSRTRRVTTLRRGVEVSRREQVLDLAVPPPLPPPPPLPAPAGPPQAGAESPGTAVVAPAPPVEAAPGTIYATLAYEDRQGSHRVAVTTSQIVIGRGGVGYWVDVKLDVSADVSREHLRLRRDEATGQFFLKDLSSLGTSIDGVPVPTSIEVADGRKRDIGVEVPLPGRARIGLASVIVLDFESAGTP